MHALVEEVERADDFVHAAEVLLSRDPEIGTLSAPGSLVWILPMAPIDGNAVYLYYTFDANEVFLLAIRKV